MAFSLSRKGKRDENSLESYAKAQKKDARVNLRLNQEDVLRIRQKSEKEGIPYQTLIASTLHKFATDQLLDQDAVRLVVETAIFKKPRYVP